MANCVYLGALSAHRTAAHSLGDLTGSRLSDSAADGDGVGIAVGDFSRGIGHVAEVLRRLRRVSCTPMGLMKMGRSEVVRVDMTAPFRALIFPFLELILITGVAWMGIGWADVHGLDRNLRNGIVLIWALLSLWRFGMPLYRARRRRFIVTNLRVIAREGGHIDSIPLQDIRGARRRRGGISLAIHGYERPMYFSSIPRAKRVEEILNEQELF